MIRRNELFVDTSGWAEVVDQTLIHHARAVALIAQAVANGRRLITTSSILSELTALLSSPLRISKPKQIQLVGDLRNDPTIEIVFIDEALDREAWHFWESRPYKDWSLVDCASFVVMQRERLTEVIAADHHFEQAGFVRLLK